MMAKETWLILDRSGPRPTRPEKSLLIWEIIFTGAFPVDVSGATIQPATKGIGVAQVDFANLHAQFIHLLGLIDLRLFHTNSFWIKHQYIHA